MAEDSDFQVFHVQIWNKYRNCLRKGTRLTLSVKGPTAEASGPGGW